MRDPETGNSKGFAFINFASFDAADAAIEAMNGQHLCNRPISISYAFKKDAKGERHGSAAGKFYYHDNYKRRYTRFSKRAKPMYIFIYLLTLLTNYKTMR